MISTDCSSLLVQVRGADTGSARFILTRRVYTTIGARRTTADSGNVDELYRLELGLQHPGTWVRDTLAASDAAAVPVDPAKGWQADSYRETTRLSLFATPDGKRGAFVRLPERKVAVIILSDTEALDARGIAESITRRLVGGR